MRGAILIDLFNKCLPFSAFGKFNHIIVVERTGFTWAMLLELHDKFARQQRDNELQI